MFCLRVDPYSQGLDGLQVGPAQENLTESLVVAEKIRSFPKPIPLPKGRVLRFRALLDAKHNRLQVILPQAWNIQTDDEDIAALGEELSQFAADCIRETLLLRLNTVIG